MASGHLLTCTCACTDREMSTRVVLLSTGNDNTDLPSDDPRLAVISIFMT
jgi:hypothetical protein